MIRRLPTAFLLAALLGVCSSSFANSSAAPKKGKKKNLSPVRILDAWDLDKDRRLTEEEFSKSRRARHISPDAQTKFFKKLDLNRDGFLDLQELRSAFGGRMPWLTPKFLKDIDADGNGEITFAEFEANKRFSKMNQKRRDRIFKRLDSNKDGMLSQGDVKDRKKRGNVYFQKLDDTGNGFLSLEEFKNSQQAHRLLKARFEFLDWNDDGRLSESELYRKDTWRPFDGRPESEKVEAQRKKNEEMKKAEEKPEPAPEKKEEDPK